MLFLASFCFIACNGNTDDREPVDYSKDNSYEIEVTEDKDAVTYMPVGAKAKYGLLFYVGTSIPPECYAYLAEPLAKQGYAVVISKLLLAYLAYAKTEPAFQKYPNIEFFIGGHSQGGGAAVRRAQENSDSVKGVILCAPLCYGRDTIKDSAIPTLLLEATKDGVLKEGNKVAAKAKLPDTRTEYMLEGCHMSFSSMDGDGILELFHDGPATEEEKISQKELTYSYVLKFMRENVQFDALG